MTLLASALALGAIYNGEPTPWLEQELPPLPVPQRMRRKVRRSGVVLHVPAEERREAGPDLSPAPGLKGRSKGTRRERKREAERGRR